MHHCERINSSCNIVDHDPGSFWKSLQLSDRRWFDDVEGSKKYKTGEESFPCEGNGDERDQLPVNFVDHDEAGVFLRGSTCNTRGRGDADDGDHDRERDDKQRAGRLRHGMR